MLKPKVGDKFVCTCDDRARYGYHRGNEYEVVDVHYGSNTVSFNTGACT